MSEPKRWSSSGSDVDPVLRSVLRYARDVAPTPSEARALLQGVLEADAASPAESAPRSIRRPSRARPLFVAAGLTVACAGAAWASSALHGARVAREPPVATEAEPHPAAPPRSRASAAPVMSAEEPASAAPATRSLRAVRDSAPPASTATLDDAGWLQAARRVVVSNPSRALTLIREHAQRFPHSPLAEERSALQIEALFRMGRSERAQSALATFEQTYPRSPYRRRLQTLLGP